MRNPILLFALLASPFAHSQSTYLKVGEAKTKKSRIALIKPNAGSPLLGAVLTSIQDTVQKDLEFTDQFQILAPSGFPKSTLSSSSEIQADAWTKAGADFLSFGTLREEGGRLEYEFHFWNTGSNQEVLAKRYSGEKDAYRILAHTIANDLVLTLTGKKGIFLTRLLFVCDKTGKKELFTSGFDGSDPRQVTRIRSLSMAPTWSPDGTKLAFSVYNRHSDGTKNIDLFEYSFKSGGLKLLSNKPGINSGAAFSPDGKKLAYTMSYTGNPEVHLLDLETGTTTQITRSIGFDVDPAFSPDGSTLALVSSRPGKPMIYTLNLKNPTEVKRLTYAGAYNATPSWSPDQKTIAFAGWLEKHFDLFIITPDGSRIERLTKDEGNNEDPSFSPDGNYLTFTSSRSGGKNIFVMSAAGGNVHRVTFGMGNCVAPKWSPFLQ